MPHSVVSLTQYLNKTEWGSSLKAIALVLMPMESLVGTQTSKKRELEKSSLK
jgi:hypothetical protein